MCHSLRYSRSVSPARWTPCRRRTVSAERFSSRYHSCHNAQCLCGRGLSWQHFCFISCSCPKNKMSEPATPVEAATTEKDSKYRMQAAAFLGLVGGVSALFGFSKTLGKAKESQSKIVEKSGREAALLLEEGSALALRALGWGTLYAILGTGAFCYGVWKFSGAKNMEEFRMKMGSGLPRITRDTPPSSPTDFETLTDFMKYLASGAKE